MKKIRNIAAVSVAAFLIVIILIQMCLSYVKIDVATSSAWAAWVQGVGSIMAVIGAFMIMYQQNENARRLAAEVEAKNVLRRLQVISALIDDAHRIALKIKTHTEPIDNYWDYFFTVMHFDELLVSIRALETIPLHSIDLPEVAIHTQRTMYFMKKLIPPMEKYEAQETANYQFLDDEASIVLYCFKNIDESKTEIVKAIEQFKSDHLAI